MNTILYSLDYEPITIIDLPREFLDKLETNGHATLMIKDTDPIKTCKLYCGSITWPDLSTKIVVITKDEEEALMLKCDWLPGQVGTVNIYKRNIRKLMDKVIRGLRGE
jgi:hypothetical protein